MFKQFDQKERTILLAALLSCFALLYLLYDDSLITDSFSGNETELIGKLSLATGDVRHKNSKDFQWKNAKQDRKLFWGDGVFTGGSSRANVELLNGATLELDPNSLVILTPNQKDLTLDLRFGQFKGDLNGQDLQVRVGGETLTVSGKDSVVRLGRDASKELMINVVKGSVDIKGANGSRTIASGTNAKVSADGRTVGPASASEAIARNMASKPETIPPVKPDLKRVLWQDNARTQKLSVVLDENGSAMEKTKVDLKWIPASDKSQTIVELSKDPNFSSTIMSQNADGSSMQTELEGPGFYFARLKMAGSPDAPWSISQRIEIKGVPIPPVPAPALSSEKVVIDPEATNTGKLQWKAAERADSYMVEYSKDADFKTVSDSFKTKNLNADFVATRPGKTYFRVRGYSAGGKPGEVSTTGQVVVPNRALSLSPIENREVFGQSPKAPPETIDVKVNWSALKTASNYEVQMSQDPKFKKDVQKFLTPTNSGTLKVSEPGDYNVRIRPLDPDKKPTGLFTQIQKFSYTYKIPLAQPFLVEPMANSTIFFQTSGGPFWFVWKKVRQAEVYELEVATDTEFKTKLVSKKTATNRLLFDQKVPSGQLYWRVRASNPERESHWSETRAVKIFSGRRADDGE